MSKEEKQKKVAEKDVLRLAEAIIKKNKNVFDYLKDK